MEGGEGCPVPRGERYGRTLIISPLTPSAVYPLPHELATHPHERHRNGLETNLFLFLSASLPLFLFLSFSLCGFSRISSPYFSPFPSLLPHPYALREIDFSTESPLPAFPTGGTKELQCFCNVFDIVHASRNYYFIKKPSATSR